MLALAHRESQFYQLLLVSGCFTQAMGSSYLYLLCVLVWLSSWRTVLYILHMAARQSGKGSLHKCTY